MEQIHTKQRKTLEFKLTQSKENFSFTTQTSIEECWMVGFKRLEVFNSFFSITEENSKLEFYTDLFDDFSFTEIKDELEEILGLSDASPKHLQHNILGPRIIETNQKISSEERQTNACIMLLWVMLDLCF